jgi:YVTN family beta-propeller protein
VAALAAGIGGVPTLPPALAAGLEQAAPPVAPDAGVGNDAEISTAASDDDSPDVRDDDAAAGRTVNVYAATMRGIAPQLAGIPERVYVPNEMSGTVTVIDAQTYQVAGRFNTGRLPEHVTPAWDLTTLYVNSMQAGILMEVDPATSAPVGQRGIPAPYNLYFTPDGSKAIVVAEPLGRLDFYDRVSWRFLKSVPVPWRGVDHLDFSADGQYLLASTEYAGVVVKVDVDAMAIVGRVNVGGLPIDVRLAPDGSIFYIANQSRNGVSLVDGERLEEVGFLPTGRGAHGLVVGRNARSLFVGNRLEGSISAIDAEARQVVATWKVGGSPDMLQVSTDGRALWISNRFGANVTVVDTDGGAVLAQIPVGSAPHGLAYFPQPGKISLGHNGVYR